MNLEQLKSLLMAGRKLQCEAAGHNTHYQFSVLVYQVSFVDGKFTIVCMAGPAHNATEYKLWFMQYDEIQGMMREQPFDLSRFRVV